MKRIANRLFALLFIPKTALAATALSSAVSGFFARVLFQIINPLITLGFAVAIVYLAWAVLQYTMGGDKFDQGKLKSALIYGVLGVTIMATVFGIMKFIAVSVGQPTTIVTNNV